MTHPAKLAVFYPKTVIALTLAITALLATAIAVRGLGFSGSPDTLARNDQALQFFNEARATFGDDRVIIVALTTSDAFSREFLERLDRLTSRLAALDGVSEALSLTNLKAIRRDGPDIRVERLIPRPSAGGPAREQLGKLRDEITRDPLYARHYVSEDGRTAAISVFMEPLEEARSRAVAGEVERVARSEAAGDELLLSGVPVLDARGTESMFRDMMVCSPIAALLCFAFFFAAFRSFWGAILPMLGLAIGLVWTLGLMALAGRPITFATLPLPTVLMAVGSSYIFHVLNQYRLSISALDPGTSFEARQRAWLDGLKFIGPAVIVSATATMAGFGALASSSIPTVRDTGIFEALGVLALLLLTLGFIPAALALIQPKAMGRAPSRRKDYATWLNRPLANITALILFRRRQVFLVTAAITLLIGAGALRLRADTDYLNIFPRASDTVQSAIKLHERLAGAATVQIIVSDDRKHSSNLGEFLRAVESLQKFAHHQSGVDATLSVADIVKRVNSATNFKSTAEIIPEDSQEIEIIISEFLSKDEAIYRLVNPEWSRAVIIARTNLFSSNKLRELTDNIARWSIVNLPQGISAEATGSVVLLNDASDGIAASQSSSLAIALATIYLMMVVLFRSFATALLALIPNLLPIVCYFGFLGWTGITLDITTSLVASAALGLAVDNAVHLIRRYRQSITGRARLSVEKDSAGDEGWVMWLTMLRTGKPTVLANLMLMAAFLIFVFSSFTPVRVAGLLWAVTILACLAADMIFLPVLMKSRLFARAAAGRVEKEAPQPLEQEYSELQKASSEL